MTSNILVDSDILIEVNRARNSEILTRWADLGESQNAILCSPVSIAELWRGVLRHEEDLLIRLFQTLVCIPITAEIGRKAGDFLRAYSKSHDLKVADAFIAASAVLHGAALWTCNRKHYPMKDLSFF